MSFLIVVATQSSILRNPHAAALIQNVHSNRNWTRNLSKQPDFARWWAILLIHNLTVMLVASGFGVHSIRSADFFAVSVLIGVPILLVALTTVAALANGDRWRHYARLRFFWIVNAFIYWLLGVVGLAQPLPR